MTDKARLAALEAVAEAAANYRKARLNDHPDMIVTSKRSQLYNALDALPADPAPAEVVEVMEVAVWEYQDGEIRQTRAGSNMDRHYHAAKPWTRLGTVRLPLVKGDGA